MLYNIYRERQICDFPKMWQAELVVSKEFEHDDAADDYVTKLNNAESAKENPFHFYLG